MSGWTDACITQCRGFTVCRNGFRVVKAVFSVFKSRDLSLESERENKREKRREAERRKRGAREKGIPPCHFIRDFIHLCTVRIFQCVHIQRRHTCTSNPSIHIQTIYTNMYKYVTYLYLYNIYKNDNINIYV